MSRYKPKNGGTPEVHSARSKLDGVLQNLREKTEDSSQEDSFIKEEPIDSDEYGSPSTSSQGPFSKSSQKLGQQPAQRHYIFGKKSRKRALDASPGTESGQQFHHTYVLKLFDRSVDLAQFGEKTSLYPVCRAWMKNQPHNRNLGIRCRTPTPEPEMFGLPEDENDIQDVYRMPPPVYKTFDYESRQLSNEVSRVPSPVPQPNEQLDIHADPEEAVAPEQLLLDHLLRWRETRKKWKEHTKTLEEGYAPSMRILKTMYDRANNS